MSSFKIVACGLPSSGKTTFLAALWYLVCNHRTGTALEYGKLPKARTYLNGLANLWSSASEIERTKTSAVHDVQLHLKKNGEDFEIAFPDLSGEVWENIWSQRACWGPAAEIAEGADGIIFFIHSAHAKQVVDLVTANAMSKRVAKKKSVVGKTEPWQARNTPTQVVAVDLLQQLARKPLGTRGRRLALVVSAWDCVRREESPEAFLSKSLPLLHQYVSGSNDYESIGIFGVSAQGGDIRKDGNKLRAIVDPCDRIRVVYGGSEAKDITIPLKWLMER